NTDIRDFRGIGGTPDLELNYGIQIANGSKFTNVGKVYGEYFRHIVAGGGNGYAIPMFATFSVIEDKNSYSHSVDCHSNTAFFTFNTLNVENGFNTAGLGHYVGKCDSEYNKYSGIAVGGGKNLYIGSYSVRNSWIFYREAPIINSYIGNLKINVNRGLMTNTSNHIFRTIAGDNFNVENMEIINSTFN